MAAMDGGGLVINNKSKIPRNDLAPGWENLCGGASKERGNRRRQRVCSSRALRNK